MTAIRFPLLKNRWMTISVSTVIVVATVAAAIGFVWIPTSQNGSTVTTFWDAICSAAGVPSPYRPLQIAETATNRPSDLFAPSVVTDKRDGKSISRGTELAMQCTGCHVAGGANSSAFPNLAGQIDTVIYKQLADFKAGHRTNSIMQPIARTLDAQAMQDLAAFYSSLPRSYPLIPLRLLSEGLPPPALVLNGAPMRGIAACASCHGDRKNTGFTPRLEGQPFDYLSAQLVSFSHAERHNDINTQMRNVMRHLTVKEIAEVASYYASR
jgi:cytochrome c553